MGSLDSDEKEISPEDHWKKIYEKESQILYGYLVKRISPEVAADIFQESFLKLLEAMKKTQKIENHKAYLFTTARNFLILEYKKNKKTGIEGDLSFDYYDNRENLFEEMVKKDFMKILESARKELTSMENEILELRWYYGLTQKEIADIVSKSERQIRRDLEKISIKLKNTFRENGWDESEVDLKE